MRFHALRRVAQAGSVLFVVALIALMTLQWTGSIRIIVPSGNSMEPGIAAGDLVVVRDRERYVEGDVVAYKSDDIGTVLHRIVDVELTPNGPRFVLQGDNNDFLDGDRPDADAIIGESVLHLPGGAKALGLLPLVMAGSMAAWWVLTTSGAREKAGPLRTDQATAARRAGGLGAAVAFGGVALVAAMSSTIEPFERSLFHSSSLELDWSAEVEPSAVYPSGRLTTGDPAFLNAVDTIQVQLRSVFDGSIQDLDGNIQLMAIARDPSGWSLESALSDPRPIATVFQTVQGELALDELWQELREVAALTSYDPGRYDLALAVRGELKGLVGGQELSLPIDHEVDFFLDGIVLRPKPDQDHKAMLAGTVMVEDAQERMLGFGPVALPVAWVRLLAPLGLALSIVVAWWPRDELSSQELINRRFGDHVLEVHEQALPIDGPVVNVERFEDMLRLAQIEGAPILHLADGDQHEWATSAMGIWYRYLLLPSAIGLGVTNQPERADQFDIATEVHAIDTSVLEAQHEDDDA